MSKTAIRDARTLRKVLNELVACGWLRIVRQTWNSLSELQAAAGKPRPRRDDCGQATNLYIVLDGRGKTVTSKPLSRPGLARTEISAPIAEASMDTPLQICPEGPGQNDPGGPPANLPPDLDQIGSVSNEESAVRAPSVDQSTHISPKSPKKGEQRLEAWDVIVAAHAEKTKAVYGLPPLPPDLKRDHRQALAASLDGAAAEVRAKLHERTGIERDIVEVRRELAARTMHLYFKHDNEHLRRVKHALRDLPREFHARITEAMQALLRESHDAAPPRRPQLEQPVERIAAADKPIDVVKQEQSKQPEKRPVSVDKPIDVVKQEPTRQPEERPESVDKPIDVAPPSEPVEASPLPSPPPPLPSASVDTAREARKLLDALSASPPQQELFRPSKVETPVPKQSKKPALPDWMRTELEQAHAPVDKPAPGQQSLEQQPLEDKPSPTLEQVAHVERPLGRAGAPRWGAIGPRPLKVRRVSKLVPDVAKSEEEHRGVASPKT